METNMERTNRKTKNNDDNNKLIRRGKMKYFSIILTLMVTALIGRSTEGLSGFSFDQSTNQSFYNLAGSTIDGIAAAGDGTGIDGGNYGSCDLPGAIEDYTSLEIDLANSEIGECVNALGTWINGEPSGACSYFTDDNENGAVDAGEWRSTGECDVIGAFRRGVCSLPEYQGSEDLCVLVGQGDWNTDEEICIGWRYADLDDVATIPLMGRMTNTDWPLDNGTPDDPSDDYYPNTFYYANENESAYLKIYDASNGYILELNSPDGGALPGWVSLALQDVETMAANNTFGCSDPAACNYDENAGVTADDGSCLSDDCFGVCGGSAVEDACEVCGGDGSDDLGCGCFQDGPSGCDNVCGSTAIFDECGACDGVEFDCTNPASACSCAGCDNSDADNHDENATVGDGTCTFTVPPAHTLVATAEPGRVKLNWSAPNDNFTENTGYSYQIWMNDVWVQSTAGTSATVPGLDPTLYCFKILADHSEYGLSLNADGTNNFSNEDCATPELSTGGPCWRIQLTADLLGYGQFPVTDDQNWLGTADDATWGYDENHDILEPPHDPEHWVSLYFPHPEWDAYDAISNPTGNAYDNINFTEDIVNSNPYYHQHNLTRWDFEVVSSMPGPASVKFTWEDPAGDGCGMQDDYKFYVLYDATDDNVDDPHYYEVSDGSSLPFYLGTSEGLEQTKQNFSMFIGNIVPQAPQNLDVTGGDRDMSLSWSDDTCDTAADFYLDDIRCRYSAASYNVYRDGAPSADNYVDSEIADGQTVHFARDHHAGGSGLGDASLLSETSDYVSGDMGADFTVSVGQSGTTYYDNNDSNPNVNAQDCSGTDGLLYESYYKYTVTSSNAAGESSEGHIIRPSGSDNGNAHDKAASASTTIPVMDDDKWTAGRLSQDDDWTDRNTNPTSITAHDGAEDTDSNSGGFTIVEEDGGSAAGNSGTYRIPHNSSKDDNVITACVQGDDSNDDNETDGAVTQGDDNDPAVGDPITRREWSIVSNSGNITGFDSDETQSAICFTDYNTFAAQGEDEVDQEYILNFNVEDTYPVKATTLDANGNWVALTVPDMEANSGEFFSADVGDGSHLSKAEIDAGGCGLNHHQGDDQLTVTIKPEPNHAPEASLPMDLIEPGDGLADNDMNYDEIDQSTGDCIAHQLNGEHNGISNFCDYGETDNDYDSNTITWVVPHDGDTTTTVAHLWFRAEDSYDPDNRDAGGNWTGANDNFDADADVLTYKWFEADGVNDLGEVWDDHDGDGEIDPGELDTYADVDLGTDSYDDFTEVTALTDVGYNNINLDLERSVQADTPSARLIKMVVTDDYGYADSTTLVVQVTKENNVAPTAGQLDAYLGTAAIDQQWIVEYMDNNKETEVRSHQAADADDDDLDYWWTYDSGTGGIYDRVETSTDVFTGTTLVEGNSILPSRYNFLDHNVLDVENCAGAPSTCGDGLATENSDVDLWSDLVLDLNVGTHVFTFHARDNYDASASTSISIVVANEPAAAQPEIEIVHEDLRYVTIDVRESELTISDDTNIIHSGPDGAVDYEDVTYTGSTWNTAQLSLYRDGELLHTWNDVNEGENYGRDSGERRYVDSPDYGDADADNDGLDTSTDYIYTVEARNSDLNTAADSDSSEVATTGDRPTVTVTTPNGGDANGSFEIWSIGDIFDVDFTTTNPEYISRIEVEYSRDGGATWSAGTDNHDCCNPLSNQSGAGCYDNPNSSSLLSTTGWYSDNPACYNAGDELYVADGWVEVLDGADGDPDDYDTNDEHDNLSSADWTENITNSTGCDNSNGFDNDPDLGSGDDSDCCVGCVGGDGVDEAPANNTANFGISDNAQSTNPDDDITNQAMVRVRVYDKGDYYGNGIDSNQDASDDVFTMADHRLHRTFSPGWHLFGPALEQYDNNISVGVAGGSDGNDDGLWWSDYGQSIGDWGSNWIIYTADGVYDNISSHQGLGYYLALATQQTMEVTGTPAIIDNNASGTSAEPRTADGGMTQAADKSLDGEGDWILAKGWNLVSNPLVVMVSKYNFDVCEDPDADGVFSDLDCASYSDAVNNGWIAPSVYGWFENSYEPYVRLMPFSGYWVNTSRPLKVKIRPHYLDSDGNDLGRDSDIATSFKLNARDISGEGSGDFITVGLSENADNKFVYGEDEYDLPKKAYTAMGGEYIDLKVGSDLMKDMKSSEYSDYQAWVVSITNKKVDNDIELSWGDVSGFEDDLHIIVNGEAINMHEERIAVLSSMVEEVIIVAGNVDSYLNPIPEEFGLNAAYPNPFNPTTTLGLALNVEGHVNMSVFNIRGQVVEVLVDGNMKAGYHNVTWNADGISSGMYFVQVETGANTAMQKLMLMK